MKHLEDAGDCDMCFASPSQDRQLIRSSAAVPALQQVAIVIIDGKRPRLGTHKVRHENVLAERGIPIH